MKFGIIKETKVPHEDRVAFTPQQCQELQAQYNGLQIVVEPYEHRCYSDAEYAEKNITLNKELRDCDVLFGVKELRVDSLLPNATYCCFSHTIKKQAANRRMLQRILEHKITLIDYEMLTDEAGTRVVAFGTYAGVCGAHNAIWTYGARTGLFTLPRLHTFAHYTDVLPHYKNIKWPPMKIVLTGSGRVGKGAAKVLTDMGFRQLSPEAFLNSGQVDAPVFTQLRSDDYIVPHDAAKEFNKADFYRNPAAYKANFLPYMRVADIFINGIFWNPAAPRFFEISDLAQPDIVTKVIADITCDIAPESSIPTTYRPSSIDEPVYGVDRQSGREVQPFEANAIDIMAIDNVANELSRDASHFFGEQLIRNVIPEFFKSGSEMLRRATIATGGQLTPGYKYLSDYVAIAE